ncbi:MAG: TetR/AcrR family transcriptional regulator, partial [Acidimicrobiia bacterium]|nr:TetR/AcrR family transcriptional regulator [Acidimicrobiia bacterium]
MLIKPVNKPTIARRAPSQRTNANTVRVLKAIMRNASELGIDELSATRVAKLSGLTTGAIYGRFEDHNEMAVELWQSVIRQPFRARLQRSVEYLSDRHPGSDKKSKSFSSEQIATIAKDFETPNEMAKVGAEFLVIARRNLAVGEVVLPEVTGWFNEVGLSRTNEAIDNAAIAIALSASIGTALRAFVMKSNPNWLAIANGLRNAATGATSIALQTKPEQPKWINPETDNPARTALINAVAEVVAKSGYANATISRIVRRAGVTNGSLYNLYTDKEALTDDAMQIFLNLSSDANRQG